MKRTLTLSTLFLTLLAAPAIAQTPSTQTPSNGMFDRLQGGNKPFAGGMSPQQGSGCGGCAFGRPAAQAPQSRAQAQMNVIMPMIFALDLSPEQKSTIEKHLRTLQAQAGADPQTFDTQRKKTLRAIIATLTADQRSRLLEKLAK